MTPKRQPTTEELLRAQQVEDDTRWLMTDPRGRRLMWAWLADAGLFRSAYTGEQHSTDFNLGMHNFGLKLHAQVMQHAPEAFLRMLAEAQAEAASRAHKPGRMGDSSAP